MAAASVVVSSPAFAYDVPSPPASPILSAVVSGTANENLTVTVSPGSAGCPGSAMSESFEVRAVAVVRENASVVGPTSQTSAGGPITVSFTRVPLPGGGPAQGRIRYFVRYTCTYGTGSSEICRRWNIWYGRRNVVEAWQTSPRRIGGPTGQCP